MNEIIFNDQKHLKEMKEYIWMQYINHQKSSSLSTKSM